MKYEALAASTNPVTVGGCHGYDGAHLYTTGPEDTVLR